MQLSADTKDKVYIHRKRYKEGVKNKTRLYTSPNLRGLKRDMTFYKAYSCSTNILLEESGGGGGREGRKNGVLAFPNYGRGRHKEAIRLDHIG